MAFRRTLALCALLALAVAAAIADKEDAIPSRVEVTKEAAPAPKVQPTVLLEKIEKDAKPTRPTATKPRLDKSVPHLDERVAAKPVRPPAQASTHPPPLRSLCHNSLQLFCPTPPTAASISSARIERVLQRRNDS